MASLLHGDGGDAGIGAVADSHHVADGEDLGVAGEAQVGLDRDPAAAVELRAGRLGELGGQRRCDDARGPHRRARGDPLAVLDQHAVRVDIHHGVSGQRRDAQPFQRPVRLLRQRLRERREHAVAVLDQQDANLVVIEPREGSPRLTRDLGDLAGELDAGWPGADDGERQPRGPALRVALDLGGLEGAIDARTDAERVVERLHRGRVRAPLVVAEVRVARAGGDDQRVVGDGQRLRVRRLREHLPAHDVEAGDVREHDPDVALALEHRAQRDGDLAGRERAGRDLVEQRREEVMVAPVDQRDLDVGAAQLADGLQAAEPAADHDDAVRFVVSHGWFLGRLGHCDKIGRGTEWGYPHPDWRKFSR